MHPSTPINFGNVQRGLSIDNWRFNEPEYLLGIET